jgi:predicted ATPase
VRQCGELRNEHENYGADVSSHELVLNQIRDPRSYLPSHTIKTAIASMAFYDTFNTTSDSKIRKPAEYNSAMKLNQSGENLVQLLSNLKNADLWTYQEIEKQLATVNPGFLSLEFNPFGSQLYLSMREAKMSHTIGMQHISDGTLRYILLMSILLNKQRGAIVGLDEPEGRLHPDMINSAAKMLRQASKSSQLIIATHSPLLLNAFSLEDVLVFEKEENNASVVKRYYEEDFSMYEGDLLPGQLWLRGEIGGKRW